MYCQRVVQPSDVLLVLLMGVTGMVWCGDGGVWCRWRLREGGINSVVLWDIVLYGYNCYVISLVGH